MNHTAIRWKNLDAMIWSLWRMGIKQLENTKTKKEPNRTEFHHFMNLAGTQIDVSICFTEYSQLSSLAAELWTSCCPLLVCDNILNSWIIMKTWNKCSLEQSVTHTHTQKQKKKWQIICQGIQHSHLSYFLFKGVKCPASTATGKRLWTSN